MFEEGEGVLSCSLVVQISRIEIKSLSISLFEREMPA